jgi:hypothetical protein
MDLEQLKAEIEIKRRENQPVRPGYWGRSLEIWELAHKVSTLIGTPEEIKKIERELAIAQLKAQWEAEDEQA